MTYETAQNDVRTAAKAVRSSAADHGVGPGITVALVGMYVQAVQSLLRAAGVETRNWDGEAVYMLAMDGENRPWDFWESATPEEVRDYIEHVDD